MSADCSSLFNLGIPTNINFNETNKTLTEIWLEEDFTLLFSGKFWTIEFFTGLIITLLCAVITSFLLTYSLFQYDKSQKLIKLKIRKIKPILKSQVAPYLSPYINHNTDLLSLIFEFSGIKNESHNLIEYQILSWHSISQRTLLNTHFLIYISIHIHRAYILFHCAVHLNESYRSFLEPCVFCEGSLIANRVVINLINAICQHDNDLLIDDYKVY